MNIHDIDIELPEPAFTAGTKIGTTTGFFCRDSKIKKGDGAYTREQVIAAIEADRKRRGEPIAWVKPDIVENQFINIRPRRVWWECNEGIGMAIYTTPQPADPSRSEPEVSTTQVLITLGKVIAGYRPGEEGWSEYDQQAYDAAMSPPQPLSESDMFVELVGGLSAEQLAEILAAYIKPEIIGEALKKLENAPWELSEPVAADFLAKGKLHGPLGWIANNTNPEPVNSDRQMLLKLMEAFDIETWQCPSCGHTEDTATMDSAYMLRDYLKDATVAEPEKIDVKASVQSDDDVFSRLYEIANRDTAVSVTVRADDLRDLLARYR